MRRPTTWLGGSRNIAFNLSTELGRSASPPQLYREAKELSTRDVTFRPIYWRDQWFRDAHF
jgi:hypothetical protein